MTRNERRLRALEKQMSERSEDIKAIWKKADDEDRETTEDERLEVEKQLKAIEQLKDEKAEVEQNIEVEKDVEKTAKSFGPTKSVVDTDMRVVNEPPRLKSLGEQFTDSDAYKKTFAGGVPSGEWSTGSVDLNTKATVLSGGTLSGSGPFEQNVPGIVPVAEEQPGISDYLPQMNATSPQIRYFEERVATNAAAGVAEGSAKPEETFDFQAQTENVTKIAAFLPIADEMLEDAPQIQTYLNSRLVSHLRQEEERQILHGDGSGANEIQGFAGNNSSVGTATVSGTASGNAGTAIFGDLLTIMNNQRGSSFLDPTLLVLHPNEFGTLLSRLDSNAQYYGGGPLSPGAYGGGRSVNPSRLTANWTVWNVPIYVTARVGAGTSLLGHFGADGAALWRRGGVSVSASNSHASFFRQNQTAIRVEERAALTVYRPEAFTVVLWD